MSVNIESIMSKVNAFAASAAGTQKMNDVLEGYRKSGKSKTAAGSTLLGPAEMEMAAARLANSIISAAASYDIAASVMQAISSLTCSKAYELPDGTWRVDLYFTANLARESLMPDGYPDGISNIIALFNNGYLAGDFVYGYWDNHSHTGNENILRQIHKVHGMGYESAYVRSKLWRPALQFMQKAVNDFNRSYGTLTGAEAILAPIYEEVPTVMSIS